MFYEKGSERNLTEANVEKAPSSNALCLQGLLQCDADLEYMVELDMAPDLKSLNPRSGRDGDQQCLMC